MHSLKNKINRRYIIFVSIASIVFLSVFLILRNYIFVQNNDASLINIAGKQRMLSQRISKLILTAHYDQNFVANGVTIDSLKVLTTNFVQSHNYLTKQYKETAGSPKLEALFVVVDKNLNKLVADSQDFIASGNLEDFNMARFRDAELAFLFAMDAIVDNYQEIAEANFSRTQHYFYIISGLAAAIIIAGFYFLWFPFIRLLIIKNKSLNSVNKNLQDSQSQIKSNLSELEKLKSEIESKQYYNQIFIQQAAPSLAMLDVDMKYIAVSEKWKEDYSMQDKNVIGLSHYEVFPEIGDAWKADHQACLKGHINTCDEAPFVRADGSVQWIFWDVRPWYQEDGNVGGLLMFTGDITKQKLHNLEKLKVESILKKTNEVARIGTWELDVATDLLTFSPMSREFLKLDKSTKLHGKDSLHLYKEGVSRDKIVNAIRTLLETGEPFDLELEVVDTQGGSLWVRDIGQAEIVDGKCIRAYGVVQDITALKLTELELRRQNQLLSFAENINKIGNWQWFFKENKVVWSDGLYDVMGITKTGDTMTIEEFASVVHPEDATKLQLHMETTIKNKKFDGELFHRIIAENGTVKTIQILGKVFTDENNEITEIIGSCQDITHLRMAEIKFKGLLESAPDAMVILNEDKKIHLVNRQAEKMFGYSAIELLDQPIEILLPTHIIDDFKKYRDDYFANPRVLGMTENKELIGINKKGEEFTVQVSLSPLKTEDGTLVSAAIRDITKQKEDKIKLLNANENLELLAQKLLSQNTQLEDFAQITSHNLRAPVSNLNSLLDMYDLSLDQTEKEEVFDNFKKVIDHLTLTLNTLVQALKVKNQDVSQTTVYFDETLQKTKEILAAQIIQNSAKITFDFSEVNKINFNKIYFESIFLNLVENALKYRSQTRTPVIHIWTTLLDGKAVLNIKDNGLGIDLKRHKHKLFGLNKVFHRHPEARGVGLFMTKLHVEALGGSIAAESVVDQGATFIINFNK